MANEYSLFNLKIIFGKLLFRIISSVIEPANYLLCGNFLDIHPIRDRRQKLSGYLPCVE
jgi:hypothetical protein